MNISWMTNFIVLINNFTFQNNLTMTVGMLCLQPICCLNDCMRLQFYSSSTIRSLKLCSDKTLTFGIFECLL